MENMPARLARMTLEHAKSAPNSPFNTRPKQGFLRGIDFYSETNLVKVLTNIISRYKNSYNEYPNILNPIGYSEKINWIKIFGEIKVPESGNKLLTDRFIPQHLRHEISCPEIVWHSPVPRLPLNSEIPAGDYYLKANHGSGMFRKISYPLGKKDRESLQETAQKWLSNNFGISSGEWFYNTFQKEIMLERSVSRLENSVTIMNWAFNGKSEFITAIQKTENGVRGSRFDSNFAPHPTPVRRPPVQDFKIPDEGIKKRIKYISEEISKNYKSVRIDFLISDDEKLYLNEITHTPGDGIRIGDKDFDLYMGSLLTL